MAAYGSLLSLGDILDRLLQHPPRQRAVLDQAQIHSLLQNITFLQDFLEEFSLMRGEEIQALEERITLSAYAAEDIIQRRVVDQILEDAPEWISSTLFCQDLQKVIEDFASTKKDVMKIKEAQGMKMGQHPKEDATAGSFIRNASDSKNTMVGFDQDLSQIVETLTGDESKLQILPVVGMGGIGKTTLAKNVFDNPLIVHHFDSRAWVTISQQYSVHEILSGLLKDIGVLKREGEEIVQKNDEELGLCLHRSLFGRRYFIVMDDMWSIQVWDGIKRFFPDNDNGSRVMVTTRLSNVADHFRSCAPHQLHFLDEDQSWVLFCDKVFGKESCPPELEKLGKTIVRNCGALPLAIVAMSGLLAKSSQTFQYWEDVANDTYAALNVGGDGLCFEILFLSYKHLPVHLKPCFLYMSIFPEDSEIRISRLVKLWIAEGILRPSSNRSLEEIAEDNLKDLIDRNLIQAHDYGSRNKIKTCTVHDLFRDLCLREAKKEKFRCVTMMPSSHRSRIIDTNHLLIIQRNLLSEEGKLYRIRKVLQMGYICSHEEIVRIVNSRHIDFPVDRFLTLLYTLVSLSVVWNLQTITVTAWSRSSHRPSRRPSSPMHMSVDLPAEIWEMPQLRHVKCKTGDFNLPDPPSKNRRRDIIVLKNLQTLHKIRNLRCTDEVVGRIPNLRKLGITYKNFPDGLGWDDYQVHNLARLHSLESLFLESEEKVPQTLCFPGSLKILTLVKCELPWEHLSVVGSLPHLEVLNLMYDSVKGREWNPVEGQFLELKCLRIQELANLEEWTADSSHFPSLEKLQLAFLTNLKEIPQGIGEIPTLGSILLENCGDSAKSSAEKIREEQQNLGNYNFQLEILEFPC